MPRRGTKRAAARRSFDWVTNLETYNRATYTLTAGAGAKLVLPLTYPASSQSVMLRGASITPSGAAFGINSTAYQSGVIYPSNKSMRVHRVRGWLCFNPSAWAIGNSSFIGVRLGKWEMTIDTQQFLLDAEYTMWANSGGTGGAAYVFADEKNYGEWRIFWGFSDNGAIRSLYIDKNYGQRGIDLAADESFAVNIEMDSGSTTQRVVPWLRTLVSTGD